MLNTETWADGVYGYFGEEIKDNSIRDNIKDLMDTLLNAYLSVNPK